MESNGKSNNHWKCQNHTAPNRGGWTLFHPPPTREGALALVLALKEKGKLVRCTNWLISQNYCSFWRTPPPKTESINVTLSLPIGFWKWWRNHLLPITSWCVWLFYAIKKINKISYNIKR